MRLTLTLLTLLAACATAHAQVLVRPTPTVPTLTNSTAGTATPPQPLQQHAVETEGARFVVRYKKTVEAQARASSPQTRAGRLGAMSTKAGIALSTVRTTPAGDLVVSARERLSVDGSRAMALRMMASDSNIASVEPDIRVIPASIESLNDPYYPQQWTHKMKSLAPGGAGFGEAFRRQTGSGVLVAVLDSGTTQHPDAQGGGEVAGYDFVSDVTMGGDGNGRDSDPTDPGDYCTSKGTNSTWHGTAVASQIAGNANNNYGVVGGAPAAQLMHVRVLGRCGGWMSDTADAIHWLAGKSFSGIPAPARTPNIINLSLGGAGSCYTYLQEAVNAAVAKGITVVAAAGNAGKNLLDAPSNCQGVIAVGAHTQSGDLAGYSNYESRIALTGPAGGACKTQVGAACLSTSALAAGTVGATTFQSHSQARYFNGTSAATPHVAAAAALILSMEPALTPAQVRSALITSADKHNAGTFCATPGRCGAGMLDAMKALDIATPYLIAIEPVSGLTTAGDTAVQEGLAPRGGLVRLQVVGERDATVSWQQLSGEPVQYAGPTDAHIVDFRAPTVSGLVEMQGTARAPDGRLYRTTHTFRVNEPPRVAKQDLPDGKVGVGYQSPPLPAVDADGDKLSYTLAASAPPGVEMNSAGVVSWPNPVAGYHPIEVLAQDPFGQTGRETVHLRITENVATPPPAPVNTAPVVPGASITGRAGIPLSVPFNIRDAENDGLAVTATNIPSGASFDERALYWPNPQAGQYSVTVKAIDLKGAMGQGQYTLTVQSPNRAPTLATVPRLFGDLGVPLSVQLSAVDLDSDPVSYSLQRAPLGLQLSPSGLMAWAIPAPGTHVLGVRLQDPYGASTVATIHLTIRALQNAPPVIDAVAPLSLLSETDLSLLLKVVDPNGDPIALSLQNAPPGMTLTGSRLHWARVPAGSYSATVSASDGKSSSTRTVTMSVAQRNRAPVLDGETSLSIAAGSTLTKVVRAVDPDGDALTFSVAGAPFGMTVNVANGTLSWPWAQRGSYVITVMARDPQGAVGTLRTTLTVN